MSAPLWLREALARWRFHREFGHLDRAEKEARDRGDTRAIGAVRKARRDTLHWALGQRG